MSDLEDRELSRFAEEISSYARPSAPRELRNQLRSSLLAAPLAATRATRSPLRLAWLRPLAAGIAVVALLFAGGTYAAADSLPGDATFALKRAAEETQVALTIDDAVRLQERATQSDRRIADLQVVAATRPSGLAIATEEYLAAVTRVEQALAVVLSQPHTPARDSAAARAETASADHIALLQALSARLPAQAQPGIQRAIAAQQAVHGRSGNPPGRPSVPGASGAPGASAAPVPGGVPIPSGRPSELPVSPGRGSPTGVPGRP